jgi:probable HAF family extracellular repeat protein
MKFLAQVFLSLIGISVFLAGSLLNAATPRLVSIDIKPKSDANRIDPDSDEDLHVAILSGDGFDATTVDPNTVRFGATGNEASPVHVARRDVDGNGQRDLVLRFEIQDTEIECGDTSATLTGQTSNGESIFGSSPINTVQCYIFTAIDFPGATVGTSSSKINAREQIVGGWFEVNEVNRSKCTPPELPELVSHGFLLDKGLFATIDVPGLRFTAALGINNRRQIVGGYQDIVCRRHGFLWDNGVFTTIDVPGSKETTAHGINNHGQIVGHYLDANGMSGDHCERDLHGCHGFLLDHGVFITIDITIDEPASSGTIVSGINNHGQIVGYGDHHGFLWENGIFTPIKAPGARSFTRATDINDNGQIVGFHDRFGGTPENPPRSGFVLSKGEFTSLDFPGVSQTGALGINNRGEIVGGYNDPLPHGFLATPARNRRINQLILTGGQQEP